MPSPDRKARLRRIATGAFAALLTAGAIAGAPALAANHRAKPHHHHSTRVDRKGGSGPNRPKPTPPSQPGPAGGKGGTRPTGGK
jgi:hypothetical protein